MFKRLFPPFVALMLISCAASDLPTRKVPAAHAPTAMPSPALRRCEIKVTQNGQVIDGSLNGPIRFYALRGAPFRIDVVPSECDPSIGVFLKVDDFKFVAENPVVVTTAGFGMAGDLVDRDVLFTRAEDPRITPEFANDYDGVQRDYAGLCTELAGCPTKIRAFRSYWNFSADGEGQKRTFAEFHRVTHDRMLAGFKGDMPIVVYTKVKDAAFYPDGKNAYLSVLQTHPIVLRFQ
jgi:hypothetical protein